MHRIIATTAAAAALVLGTSAFAQASPYAGEQQRSIKALDARDVAALRQGQGLGFAKAAELNGYPGPMHTLELAEPLQLTESQRAATRQLMGEHKARAQQLGEAVIQAELALDRLFAERQATPERVSEATQLIASRAGATARRTPEHPSRPDRADDPGAGAALCRTARLLEHDTGVRPPARSSPLIPKGCKDKT